MSRSLRNPTLTHDHIDFRDHDRNLNEEGKHRKLFTMMGASAISLLCYEEPSRLSDVLRTDHRFKLVKDLDIISDVWSLVDVASPIHTRRAKKSHEKDIRDTAPVLAWSFRLQTLFLGFRGTQVAVDVLTNLNIDQKIALDLGTRFHGGFFARAAPYTTLIEQLARDHKVVVCGHSLGGAIATIAAYQVLAQGQHFENRSNTWTENDRGLSVITFGSPSAMVLERVQTTAAPQKALAGNFHHIVNPDDYVPFVLNDVNNAIQAFEGAFEVPSRISEVWKAILKHWVSTRGNFAHFGCIYLLKVEEHRRFLHRITSSTDLPQRPGVTNVKQHHAMEHYNYCVIQLDDVKAAAWAPCIVESDEKSLRSAGQIMSDVLGLDNCMRECNATISDNKVTISLTMTTRLAEFIIKNVNFEQQGIQIQVSKFSFKLKADNHEQVELEIQHNLSPEMSLVDATEMVNAMKRGLYAIDALDRRYVVPIEKIQVKTLKDASLPTTFESIRLAMIFAFSEQISKLGDLRSGKNVPGSEFIPLSETTESIAGIIDTIVSTAVPHLFVQRLQNSYEVMEKFWPSSAEDDRSTISNNSGNINLVPGGYPSEEEHGLSSLIPENCSPELGNILSKVLEALGKNGLKRTSLSPSDWIEKGFPTLKDVYPDVPSFASILKHFSEQMLSRSPDSEGRIKQAIQESGEVLASMKFCYIVLLTQLDAPPSWYCKSWERYFAVSALAGTVPAIFSASSVWGWAAPAGMEGIFAFVTASGAVVATAGVGLAVFGIVLVGSVFLTSRQKELLQLQFDNTVQLSIQLLKIPSSLEDIGEMPITRYLANEIYLASDRTPQDLEKWRGLLKKGLETHPGVKNDWSIQPTIFWAKWLFTVGRIGRLREFLSEKTRIGVLGPTEAGKSELLTTLTGAPEKVFRSGSGAYARTMELQSFSPVGCNAVFMDCPGSDDQDGRIREMARLFQEVFAISLFVIPFERNRSQASRKALEEVAKFLHVRHTRSDLRPVRILLSKVDQLDHHRNNPKIFRDAVQENKRSLINELRRIGEFANNFTIHSRQAHDGMILVSTETLEDIVQPYSTHAQMSLDDKKALSDCTLGTERKIDGIAHFQNLYHMAEEGIMWDIESLRGWLRGLSPNCVPFSAGRVFQIK